MTLSKEECQAIINAIDLKMNILKLEYYENKSKIINKVKGQIRSSQGRNKEIRDELDTLKLRKDPYRNGGVW